MDQTPLMKQYLQIKKSYPKSILLFRVGDFYEMFYEDAVSASKILNIALTSRDKSKENGVPLCGIPYHALNNYLSKLIRAGEQVALCEQMEDPRTVKGIVKREVVRVISPGTLVEAELLEGSGNNYFASISIHPKGSAFAYIDISTGEFNCAAFDGDFALSDLCGELSALRPRELLLPEGIFADRRLHPIEINPNWKLHLLPRSAFEYERNVTVLQDHINNIHVSDFQTESRKAALSAAGALYSYLAGMVKTPLAHVAELKWHRPELYMMMDFSTHRSLELTQNSYNGKKDNSLLSVFDKTETPMEARKLRHWISRPLIQPEEIIKRSDTVDLFYNRFELSERLKSELKSIHDIERIISRISLNSCNGRDLIALKASLSPLKSIPDHFSGPVCSLLKTLFEKWDSLDDVFRWIDTALIEDPPLSLKEGALIKKGYSLELDELKSLGFRMKETLANLEAEEKAKTGIDSLKIRFNQVTGYYIEVSKGKVGKVPDYYQRKQTLTNAERYTIPVLLELETKIRESEKEIKELELALFEKIRHLVSDQSGRILNMADRVATLDVLNTFADVARDRGYVRPVISTENGLRIIEGRHPVIENILPSGQFVPNDVVLDDQTNMMIITGPNMAGKSTTMRQVALIAIMAQMGSFVPAKECTIGIVDKLFTRIGAADYLTQGQSTFMVEMMEAAHILHSATSKSLIILDEIGRGTSTFDGISIAWAIGEYILRHLQTRTLFATHYLELTGLSRTWKNAKNYNIRVKEQNDEIIFLRKIVPGVADRSYGIQVARLAGIPFEVTQRAKDILKHLEGETLIREGAPHLSVASELPPTQDRKSDTELFELSEKERDIINTLKKTDLLRITPLDAINLIHSLKLKLDEKSESSR